MNKGKQPSIQVVRLDRIVADPNLQVRAAIDECVVADYAAEMKLGVKFPPVVVFQDSPTATFLLADGFHRNTAARKAGLLEIQAEVRDGDRRAAITYALSANGRHGIRRSNPDKRKAVELALKEFPGQSDRSLANLCAVDKDLVATVRRQVADSATCTPPKRTGRDGKLYPSKRNQRTKVGAKCLAIQPEGTQAQVQPAFPPSAGEIPAESDTNIACETPGDQQMMATFGQLIEKVVTARPGSIPFYRGRIAAMSAWLDDLQPITNPQTSGATEDHALPPQATT